VSERKRKREKLATIQVAMLSDMRHKREKKIAGQDIKK
jgi:hypothetical protein